MHPAASAALRLALTAGGAAAACLPRSFELWAGPRLGRLVLALGLFKRRTCEENLRNCFPELDAGERAALLERNFEHYGILFFEFLHFFSPVEGHYREYMARHIVMEGVENWKRAHERGKGVIFVASHVGFWETLAAGGGLSGMEPTVVTTVLKPKWLNDKITRERSSTGVRAAYHPGSLKAVLKTLKKGGSVAFMNDQYAPPPMGIPVEFFGVRVNTLAAVGSIAKMTGAAVVPVNCYRDARGKSRVVIQPELELGSAVEDPEAATQKVAAVVESWVRRHPEQWLWMHRRFKNVQWPERVAAAGGR